MHSRNVLGLLTQRLQISASVTCETGGYTCTCGAGLPVYVTWSKLSVEHGRRDTVQVWGCVSVTDNTDRQVYTRLSPPPGYHGNVGSLYG